MYTFATTDNKAIRKGYTMTENLDRSRRADRHSSSRRVHRVLHSWTPAPRSWCRPNDWLGWHTHPWRTRPDKPSSRGSVGTARTRWTGPPCGSVSPRTTATTVECSKHVMLTTAYYVC